MRTDDAEQVDVLIVGAGLSGIGAACHLRRDCPERTFAILEARDAIGGTWDLFRYPGIRSDSDMQTLGYAFAPWKGVQAIADGPSILRYVRQTGAEYGVEERVRLHSRVVSADYDSGDCAWTVQIQSTNGSHPPETIEMRCSFLLMCTGYYRYDEGYMPPFAGIDRYRGTLVHPQHWPEQLDYAGRRVVVIGSGATAITLVPAMARTAAHVTMLQRSPTSRRAMTRGTSACAWPPTPTCSRRCTPGRPRSLPTGSRPSPSVGSSSPAARSSRPT